MQKVMGSANSSFITHSPWYTDLVDTLGASDILSNGFAVTYHPSWNQDGANLW